MIYLIPAGLLFLMGWLIRYKKYAWLISGYNISSKEEKEKYDLDKLTRLMGSFLFLLGACFSSCSSRLSFSQVMRIKLPGWDFLWSPWSSLRV